MTPFFLRNVWFSVDGLHINAFEMAAYDNGVLTLKNGKEVQIAHDLFIDAMNGVAAFLAKAQEAGPAKTQSRSNRTSSDKDRTPKDNAF